MSSESVNAFLAGIAVSASTNLLTGLTRSDVAQTRYRLPAALLFLVSGLAFLLVGEAIAAAERAQRSTSASRSDPFYLRAAHVPLRKSLAWCSFIAAASLLALDIARR